MYRQQNDTRHSSETRSLNIFSFSKLLIPTIEKNEIELLNIYLKEDYLVNRLEEPLLTAIRKGNLDIIKCLLDHGAQINNSNSSFAPLFVAINNNCSLEVVKLLVSNGANIYNTFNSDGESPLVIAINLRNLSLLEYLISQKVNINKRGTSAHTPLSCAVITHNIQFVKILVDRGADVNIPNSDGNTAFALTECLGLTEIANYIKSNRIPKIRYIETRIRKPQAISRVDDQSNSEKNTPLDRAIISGKLDTIKTLLTKGVETCEVRADGKSPLLLAVQCKNLEAIKLLLEYGAELTIQTAFLEAINTNCVEITKYLLEKEVNVNFTYRSGCTALIKSIETNNVKIVKALVEKGANVNMIDREENLPLPVSLKNRNLKISRFLISKGAEINEKYLEETGDVKTVELLRELGIECKDIVNKNKHSLLNKAVESDNYTTVEFLIEHGAKVNETDDGKPSILGVAAKNRSFRIVKCLIDAGANISLAEKELEEYANHNEDFAIYLEKIKGLSSAPEDFKYGGHEAA